MMTMPGRTTASRIPHAGQRPSGDRDRVALTQPRRAEFVATESAVNGEFGVPRRRGRFESNRYLARTVQHSDKVTACQGIGLQMLAIPHQYWFDTREFGTYTPVPVHDDILRRRGAQ